MTGKTTISVFITNTIAITTFVLASTTAQYYGGHNLSPFSTMMHHSQMPQFYRGEGGGPQFHGFHDSHVMAGSPHGYQAGGHAYGGGHAHRGYHESTPPIFIHGPGGTGLRGGIEESEPIGHGHHGGGHYGGGHSYAPAQYHHKRPVVQPHIHREHVHIHNIYKHNIHHHNVHKQHIHQPVYHKTEKNVHTNSESHKNQYKVKEYNKHNHPLTQESHKWLKPIYAGEGWGKDSVGVKE
ncbi:histidine-rich glycoprotein isoform X2 [Folsomia candida]|uniref:histidine-rich glycoprotein isoform X2 n=1 Tax=Folsomia candida TaxID=158441 RepID=UPI000B8EF2C5|nr:histidine-rich glycoprotein isoform X2 [Folsomia candida]